mgnify:FL=1
MQISVGVRFCKAFISKNYALDSLESPLATLKKDLDLSFIPVIERRRLSEASKITLGLLGDSPLHCPIVFSSQKGEINRCFGMLQELAIHHLTSPTAFSLSVLNATPALLAITQKNHSEILAISAVDCFEYGLINAYALLCESAVDSQDLRKSSIKDCLVISYDENLGSKEISAIIACVSLDSNLPQIRIKSHKSSLQGSVSAANATKRLCEAPTNTCKNNCVDSSILIKSKNDNKFGLTSNLSFLSAVAGEIPRYENGDFALDISDFIREFSIENL